MDSYGAFDTTDSALKGTKISVGLTEEDFIQTVPPALGTDFHMLWRGADGSVNTIGYAVLDENSEYASFASDGGACGARFGIGPEFVTPENVNEIKTTALTGTVPAITVVPTAEPQPVPVATSTPVPTVTNMPAPTATNTPVPTATSTPVPTTANTPVPTVTATPTEVPSPTESLQEAFDTSSTEMADADVTILILCAALSVTIIALATVIIILLFKKAK